MAASLRLAGLSQAMQRPEMIANSRPDTARAADPSAAFDSSSGSVANFAAASEISCKWPGAARQFKFESALILPVRPPGSNLMVSGLAQLELQVIPLWNEHDASAWQLGPANPCTEPTPALTAAAGHDAQQGT